jgi:hypothetical protein
MREVLHIHLRRFDRSLRPRLRKLAERSSRLADLLYAFPGAAVALTAGERSAGAREHAARLVEKGRPLAEATKALGLPMWLKRLPPEAFRQAPPDLSRDEKFGRSIANFMPASPEESALWMNRLTFAQAACGPAFALWLARQRLAAPPLGAQGRENVSVLLPLAAFAWFSSSKNIVARLLTPSPWHEKMTFTNAVQETYAWLDRIVCECRPDRDTEDGGDVWRRPHACQEFYFRPLYTPQDLRDEGERMRNCLKGYADSVAKGLCLIFSVWRNGTPVADLDIRRGSDGGPVIAQLRGPGNTAPPHLVTQAVQIWFARLAKTKAPLWNLAPVTWAEAEISPQGWEEIWRPYWEARPRLETLLRAPEPATLTRLHADLTVLRQWAS